MITYRIDNSIYINLTNKCSNACDFCVRTTSDEYSEFDLWLKNEPTSEEVIEDLKKYLNNFNNYVFCGYGEPTERLDTLIKVAKFLKENNKSIRLNTNGQSDLINGENSHLKLINLIDCVSISLNNYDKLSYDSICHSRFGLVAFDSLINYAKNCKNSGINTVFSLVRYKGVDIDKTQKLADKLGIKLRIRELIE